MAADFHDFLDNCAFPYDAGWFFRLTLRGSSQDSDEVDYHGDDDECENEYEHEAEQEGERVDLKHGLC